MGFLADQLSAVMTRQNQNADVVLLMLSSTVSVTALREFEIDMADPMLAGVVSSKKIQLRFPASELGLAVFQKDFDIGDKCFIGGPTQLVTAGTLDQAKWELKYYRAGADGLLITVGLDSDD